jgi:hypothetical protein
VAAVMVVVGVVMVVVLVGLLTQQGLCLVLQAPRSLRF